MHDNETNLSAPVSVLLNGETDPGDRAAAPRTSRGRSAPLGATPLAEGINFVLMCRHGTSVHLVLQPMDSDNIRHGNFEDDPREPDQHMKAGWAMVRCKEASGYLWWGPKMEL